MSNYVSEAFALGVPIYKIPLQNIPQTFVIPLAGTLYDLTCKWNDAFEGGWVLDISNSDTGQDLVADLPLVVGTDLLDGLQYLGIQGSLYVYTDGNQFAPPTLANLGVESNVYFASTVSNG